MGNFARFGVLVALLLFGLAGYVALKPYLAYDAEAAWEHPAVVEGRAALARGDVDAALQALQEARRAMPRSGLPDWMLASAYYLRYLESRQALDLEQMAAHLHRSEDREPSAPGSYYTALYHYEQGDYKQAGRSVREGQRGLTYPAGIWYQPSGAMRKRKVVMVTGLSALSQALQEVEEGQAPVAWNPVLGPTPAGSTVLVPFGF